MPLVAMSSSRPTNGLMKVAPALAASSACAAEKHSVTLTRMPSPDKALQALMPSRVSGTLTTMCSSIAAMSWPSRIMPAKSVAVTSPLTGPFTMSQIFFRFCRKSPGSFASSDGLVVTPSMMPSAAMRFDVLDAAGVDEEFHGSAPSQSPPSTPCTENDVLAGDLGDLGGCAGRR